MKNVFVLFLILANTSAIFPQSQTLNSGKDPGEILWYHTVSGIAVEASNPVITPDGNIIWVKYKSAGVPVSEIFCFTPAGDTLWWQSFPDRFKSDPMIIPQTGWIIIANSTNNNRLLCLNPDGSERWSTNMATPLSQSPVIDTLFNIYLAAQAKLISYDSAGVYRWTYNSPAGEIITPLSVSTTGVIYFGTEFDKLIAVQSSGNQIFLNNLFGYVRGTPTIDLDGTIFISSSNINTNQSKIEVFNPDGSFVWEMTFNEPNPSSVIIGDSNFIYVRTMNFWGGGFGKLYKINKIDQAVEWYYSYGPNVGGAWDPTLTADGTIYITLANGFSGNAGRFLAIDNQGNLKWELDLLSATGMDMSPMYHITPGKNGNIYTIGIADYDTTCLIAIEAPDAILANSAWPMYKHDEHYTSLASNISLPQPDIVTDKVLIDFGYVEPGNSSNQLLTVFNTGNLPLSLDWILESTVFGLEIIRGVNKTRHTSEIIQPGDSLMFDISFSPVDTCMYSDTLFLMSNDPDQPVHQVALKGKSTIEGEVKWNIHLSNHLTGPAVDDYGNVYVAGSYKIWRIRPTGQIDWEYEPVGRNSRSDYTNITISHNNRFLYLPWGKTMLALDTAGNELWNFDPPANDWLYPAATNKAGQLFFSESFMNGGGHLYCLNDQGDELWNNDIGYDLGYPPAIEKNGNIVSGANFGSQGKVFCLDKTKGLTQWEHPFMPTGPASIGYGNLIYIGGRWGNLGNYLPKVRAYNASGALQWEFNIANEISEVSSSIISHPNGTLIFATMDFYYSNGTICALDGEGNFLWENLYDNTISATPAIAANGLIYFGCMDGNFYALYPDGSEKWELNTGSEIITSPVIHSNGIIYFTTEDGSLFAVYGENGGLAHSPWPMIQRDPKHTSSADSLPVFINEPLYPSPVFNKLTALPNPFMRNTTIRWELDYPAEVLIRIADLAGKEIISKKVFCKAGINRYTWNGFAAEGKEAKPGVYVCRLQTNKKTAWIKLIKNSRHP